MNALIVKTKISLGLILLLIIQFIIALPTFANVQEFSASKERITANIGAGKQNRIEFAQGRILEVIGNTSLYNLIAISNSNYIFLTPKLGVGEVIHLSIIYGNNKVQELSLNVASISGQTVFIKQDEHDDDIRSTKPQNNTEELAEIIRFMALGKVGKYNVEGMKHFLPPLVGKNLNLIFDLKYNFAASDLIGRRLRVKNTSNKSVKLSESNFEHIFENIVAVNLSKEILKPKEEGFIYLISKLKQWSKQ